MSLRKKNAQKFQYADKTTHMIHLTDDKFSCSNLDAEF